MRRIERPAELQQWFCGGASASEIGRRAGVSRKTVERWLKDAGLRAPKAISAMARPSLRHPDHHHQARSAAAAKGEKQFIGVVCHRGHDGVRWTSNGYCVSCGALSAKPRKKIGRPAQEAAALRRQAAREAGLKRFDGAPCRKCGGTIRWTSNNVCVACRRSNVQSGRYRDNPSPAAIERRKAYLASEERRQARASRVRARWREDSQFKLNGRMQRAVRNCLIRRGRSKGGRPWEDLVGWTANELREHLERQFVRGMTWENMTEWHVDHIVPIASFGPMDAGDPTFRACWALTNLRPLWKLDNMRKGPKREHLL